MLSFRKLIVSCPTINFLWGFQVWQQPWVKMRSWYLFIHSYSFSDARWSTEHGAKNDRKWGKIRSGVLIVSFPHLDRFLPQELSFLTHIYIDVLCKKNFQKKCVRYMLELYINAQSFLTPMLQDTIALLFTFSTKIFQNFQYGARSAMYQHTSRHFTSFLLSIV